MLNNIIHCSNPFISVNSFNLEDSEVGDIIIPTLQMSKLRHKESKYFAQGHTAHSNRAMTWHRKPGASGYYPNHVLEQW